MSNQDNGVQSPRRSWRDAFSALLKPPVLRMLFLGFSAGLPYLLIFSTLSIRLREAGVDRATVTFFSWAALAYSFKFVWAPLVDRLPLPILTKRLGRRRSWLLLSQLGLIAGMLWTAAFDPMSALSLVAVGAVMIGFSAATQDIAIDAYRIESAEADLQSMMSATYIAGYRLGMLTAGAGGLRLAAFLEPGGTYLPEAWAMVYRVMAGLVLVGVMTVLLSPEPKARDRDESSLHSTMDYARFLLSFAVAVGAFVAAFVALGGETPRLGGSLSPFIGKSLAEFLAEAVHFGGAVVAGVVAGWAMIALGVAKASHLREAYVAPFVDFLKRTGPSAGWILALIGLYRVSDIVMGAVANLFYLDLGFVKEQIADIAGFWGLWATILGGFFGGVVALKIGVRRALLVGAVASGATNLLFAGLAGLPPSSGFLLGAVVLDNVAGGLASAAFVAYLSSLTNVAFTAMQYALFSSLMTLAPKVLAGYSGTMVNGMGYAGFFILTAVFTVPVVGLIWMVERKARQSDA